MWQYCFTTFLAIKSQCTAYRCLQFAPHKLYVMHSLNIVVLKFLYACYMPQNPQTHWSPPRIWVPHVSPAKDLSFGTPVQIMTNPWMILRQYSPYAVSVDYKQCQLDSKETKMNFQCKFIFCLIYILQFQHNYV